MTTPTPTPENQNSPATPNSNENPRSSEVTGFFLRVRQELKAAEEPIHPTEEAEIVVMEENET